MGRTRVTLLQRLMEQRHLTHADTIRLLERRAREMGAADFTIGERTLDHWLSGTLRTSPQPVRRRVLEAEFGFGIDELLAPAGPDMTSEDAVSHDPVSHEPVSHDVVGPDPGAVARRSVDRHLVSAAAVRAARFAHRADGHAISEPALEQLRLRLAQLAAGYVHAEMWPVFTELTALRDDVFELLEAPDPARAGDLYVIAGTACAMLAHASGNLGFLGEAALQANTALICADRAGHEPLAAWSLGVRALQAEWNGQPREALTHLERAGRRSPAGTMPVWLSAIEARAQASLGEDRDAIKALDRVETEGPAGDSDLDAIGGILTFPEPKRLFYAATALRRLGHLALAESRALGAIKEYETGPTSQRSYGDEALAWIEVAIARAGQGELEGAAIAIEQVKDIPPERQLVTLLRPLGELDRQVSPTHPRDRGPARRVRQAVELLIASTRRQVADAGA